MHGNSWREINDALNAIGLQLLGGFHPAAGDNVPLLPDGGRPQALLLAGNAGGGMWDKFAASEGSSNDALDNWCSEQIELVVGGCTGAGAVYVSDGPPYWPFQAWAQRCGVAYPSPLGIMVHPRFGLWHAYRAAIVLPEPADLPPGTPAQSPCEDCTDKPCLNTCPVAAFTAQGYDVPACIGHVTSPQGAACRKGGCQARHACPVGVDYAYAPKQAAFHMASFIRGNS